MLGKLKFLVIYFLAWVLFFECARLIFLFYYFSKARELSFHTNALSFLYGLRMDVSMSAYLLLPVCIFVAAALFIPFFGKASLYKAYTYIILFFILLIVVVDLEVFDNWGFRIDATPLRYLGSPKEAWASVSHLPLFSILIIFLLVYLGLCFLFKKMIDRIIPLIYQPSGKKITAALLLIFACLLFIPIRGGLQLSPINQSSVYFSKENFANITAINATWNFFYGLMNEPSSIKNPYAYMDLHRAQTMVDSLYRSSDSTAPLLTTTRPNIILIVWESFTEKATHQQQGKEVTPGFNELKKEGIYFSHMYASGNRTDQGLAAVLSGYPAMDGSSIIRLPNKSAKLNTLGSFLKDQGYHTSFYYGGEPEFANIKSYVLQNHFDALIEKSNFKKKDLNSKWGAHDGVVAAKILADANNSTKPFFTTWLTLSSHEPFEVPFPPLLDGDSENNLFLNSLHYTDDVLYKLVQECKKQPWWNETLLIVIADHGHPRPFPHGVLDNFKIPMLWLGGALNRKGVVVDKVASQLDIAASLQGQLRPGPRLFPFSKDLFDSTALPWAYFSFNNGFGFVQPAGAFVFDNVGKRLISKTGRVTLKDIEAGKAMQQVSYEDYLLK